MYSWTIPRSGPSVLPEDLKQEKNSQKDPPGKEKKSSVKWGGRILPLFWKMATWFVAMSRPSVWRKASGYSEILAHLSYGMRYTVFSKDPIQGLFSEA